MGGTTSDTSAENLVRIRNIHQELLEKGLQMRCVSYMADVKAKLLVRTVSQVGLSKRLLADDNQSLRGALAAVEREVEARRRVESQLRDVTDAIEQAHVMLLIGRNGQVLHANRAFRECFGEEALSGSLFEVLRHVAGTDGEAPELHRELPLVAEFRARDVRGRKFWIRVNVDRGRALDPSAEPHLIAVMEDVTLAKEAMVRSVMAQRMEALGQLVGGVAHDFNNLLMMLATNLELMMHAPEEERRRLASDMLDVTLRGGQLTQQLLSFAKRQVLSPERVELSGLIESSVEMLRRTLGKDYELEATFSSDAPMSVNCDAGQLQAALVNLVVNARDASPEGGKIGIHVGREQNAQVCHCGPGDLPVGLFATVSVIDHGVGVAPAIVDRIWEPFVSTKGATGHSGLGLSMVAGFTQQSGGGVELESVPGQGTRVTLYLPVSEVET